MSFVREFWIFLIARRKFWLIPAIIATFVFGLLLILVQGTAIAPFIYTLF